MNYIIIVTFTIIIKFHRYIINEVAADFAFFVATLCGAAAGGPHIGIDQLHCQTQ